MEELDDIIAQMRKEQQQLELSENESVGLNADLMSQESVKRASMSPKKTWPKGTPEVDIMIYEHECEHGGGEFMFDKVGEGVYKFGTKKITAKVSNGVCLLRVGGGYMDIVEFYNVYAG